MKKFVLLSILLLGIIEPTWAGTKIYVKYSEDAVRTKIGAFTSSLAQGNSIFINGTEYTVQQDESSKLYIDVADDAPQQLNAVYMHGSASEYFDANGTSNVKVPFSQFWKLTLRKIKTYPMYATCEKAEGNTLELTDGFAVIDVALKGRKEQLTSIKIESANSTPLTGIANYNFTTGALANTYGCNSVVMNCTNSGTYPALSSYVSHFYIPVYAGNYADGLKIRVCDLTRKMMEINVDATELKANEILSINATYAPDEDLIFFEGFDNMVWGGDYVAGSIKGKRFAPTTTNPGVTAVTTQTGYEEAFAKVAYNVPGTGFLQSNTWSDVNGYTLEQSHSMQQNYYVSRCLWDWDMMFRCQEYCGYVATGMGNSYRGIIQFPKIVNMKGIGNVKYEFDVAFAANYNQTLELVLSNGGIVKSLQINGANITLNDNNFNFSGITSTLDLAKSNFKVATSATSEKKWNHVIIEIENATNGCYFTARSAASAAGIHGFFLDNITARKTTNMERGDLRLLYWNIQNGMWADQGNNYTNFVDWVKELDPDVCVWCEARSNYVTNSTSSLSNGSSYLPNKYSSSDTNAGWAELAKKYGHNYAALGGHRDNYPQEITSKYPITTIKKITNTDNSAKPISHGAAIQQVDVNGTKINFITLHTWPQAYGYGVSSANQAASSEAREGDYYREYEIDYILKNTYLSNTYKGLNNWVLLGDFNSYSRVDNFHYGLSEDNSRFRCHDVILNNTDMKDVIAEKYPNKFMASTGGGSRIDYVYTDPTLYEKIKNAMIVKDNWTTTVKTDLSNFYLPSDHRPILVDFQLSPVTGITPKGTIETGKIEVARYNVKGQKINSNTKGIQIIKYADGTARKIMR